MSIYPQDNFHSSMVVDFNDVLHLLCMIHYQLYHPRTHIEYYLNNDFFIPNFLLQPMGLCEITFEIVQHACEDFCPLLLV